MDFRATVGLMLVFSHAASGLIPAVPARSSLRMLSLGRSRTGGGTRQCKMEASGGDQHNATLQRGGISMTYGSSVAAAQTKFALPADHEPSRNSVANCYILLSNLQSGSNIGRIVRSASIFGVHEVVIVGQRKFRLAADHGARFDVPFRHFYSFDEAKAYLVAERSCDVVGVEIEDSASPLARYDRSTGVATFPFTGSTAFVFGNEGRGLSPKQRQLCDKFVFIPQIRGGDAGRGAASLNVACAAAIVLHAFSLWAGFPEAARAGEKFCPARHEEE